jgi:hypothetical protein
MLPSLRFNPAAPPPVDPTGGDSAVLAYLAMSAAYRRLCDLPPGDPAEAAALNAVDLAQTTWFETPATTGLGVALRALDLLNYGAVQAGFEVWDWTVTDSDTPLTQEAVRALARDVAAVFGLTPFVFCPNPARDPVRKPIVVPGPVPDAPTAGGATAPFRTPVMRAFDALAATSAAHVQTLRDVAATIDPEPGLEPKAAAAMAQIAAAERTVVAAPAVRAADVLVKLLVMSGLQGPDDPDEIEAPLDTAAVRVLLRDLAMVDRLSSAPRPDRLT